MARLGKGKPMHKQAQSLLAKHLDLSSRHRAKQALGIKGAQPTGKIHSLRTFETYSSALTQAGRWARQTHALKHLKSLTPQHAQSYLEQRASEGLSQKSLNNARVALGFIVGKENLSKVHAQNPEPQFRGRAYSSVQVEMVASAQNEKNALATRVAYAAGLRARELFTLRPVAEAHASGHRDWSQERFAGREGELYVVVGKGGLHREVMLPKELVVQLEALRLPEPKSVTDRGTHVEQYYEIGAGNAWSQSFSKASSRELGWSTGAHGLRHAYAQERMRELQAAHVGYLEARGIVSQELGHFRPEITETYLG
jgi:integrase